MVKGLDFEHPRRIGDVGSGFIENMSSGTIDSGNLYGDPSVIDVAGANFRLRPESDAVDHGVVLPSVTD